MFHLRQCQRKTRTRAGRNLRTSRIVPRDDGAGDVGMPRCGGMPSRESFGPGEQNHQQSNECPGSGYGTPAYRQPIDAVWLGFGINAIHQHHPFLALHKWVAPAMLIDRQSHS